MRKKFTILTAALALLAMLAVPKGGWGQTRSETTSTYVFNTKSWGATLNGSTANWTSGKDGNQYTANQGVQITTGVTGANATSPISFDNVSEIVVTYCTNANKGAGTIKVQVGDGAVQTFTVTAPSSGGTTLKTTTFSYDPNESGIVKITVDCTTNSIYIYSVAITTVSGGTPTPTCTVAPTSWAVGNVQAGSSAQTKQFTVTTANLTDDLSVEILDGTYYSVDVDEISSTATSTIVTVTLNPTIVGSMDDYLIISGSDFDDDIEVELTANGLCKTPANALAYTTPVSLTLSDGDVEYTLTPTANTGNGGSITYALTTNPGGNAEILNGNTFYAIEIGTYVVTATQALNGTTCGGTADITINVFGPDKTITFNGGSGTPSSASITAAQGSTIQLPNAFPSSACADDGWTFAGWTDAAVTETETAPTFLLAAGEDYVVTTTEILYAVYQLTEGEGAFNNITTTGGNFKIYAIVDDDNFYAVGTGSKIESTTTESDATEYTFEKPQGYGEGEFAIKTGSDYITYKSSTDLATSSSPYKWTITEGTYGSWRVTSETPGRALIYRAGSTERFGGYSTGNVNGTEYFDLEIGGAGTTTYNSNPSCLEQVATPTFAVTGTLIEENIYNGAISVAINCDTEDANISYKTAEDGEWVAYSAAIPISTTTTIWAKATKSGMSDSEDASATYTIQYTLTLVGNEDVATLLFDGDEVSIEVDEEGTATIEAGTEVRVSIDLIANCKVFSDLTVTNVDEITEIEPNVYYSFSMPAGNATLSVTTATTTDRALTVAGLNHVTSGNPGK